MGFDLQSHFALNSDQFPKSGLEIFTAKNLQIHLSVFKAVPVADYLLTEGQIWHSFLFKNLVLFHQEVTV